MSDPVNHPAHYAEHPSGVEVIEFTRALNFNLGNAVKYICRHQLKGKPREDIEKAIWYLDDEMSGFEIDPVSKEVKGYKVSLPTRALFALGAYLGVEAYLIKTGSDKATLTEKYGEAIAYIIDGRLYAARTILAEGLDELA